MTKREYFTMHTGLGPVELGETCEPIREFWCGIQANGVDDGGTAEIGEASGCIVPAYIGNEAIDMVDAADEISADCQNLVSVMIQPGTNDWREELNLGMAGCDLLCIDQVKILPEYRGRGIGLSVVWHLTEAFGRGCGAVVIKPHPLNGECAPHNDPYQLRPFPEMSDEEMAAGAARLAAYWGKLGFEPVPAYPEYLYFDLARLMKNCPKIRARARRK